MTTMSIGPTLENSLDCAENANFSPPLFELKHLKSLTFFKCFSRQSTNITIPFQSWESLASSLETLEFRSNQGLSGIIPSSLCNLRRLRTLVLVDNGLSGELPSELGNLTALQRLVISGNNFSGQIPSSIGSAMPDLLILDLSRNSLMGNLPSSFGSLKSLLKLDLSYNFLSGKIPPELGSITTLTLLDLRKNKFSGGLPSSLQSMASLQEMLLSDNPLGGEMQSFEWGNLKKLATLDLSGTSLYGEVPESVGELRELRALHLNDNNFTGELKFSCEFYRRLGRGFSAWGNPNLRYSSAETAKQCKEEVQTSKPETESLDQSSGSSSVSFFFLLQAGVVFVFLLSTKS